MLHHCRLPLLFLRQPRRTLSRTLWSPSSISPRNRLLAAAANGSRRTFVSASFISPRNRLLLISLGVFTGTAACSRMYQEYQHEKVRKQLIEAQVYFDPEKRELVKTQGTGSLVHSLTADQMAKIRSIAVSYSVVGPTVVPGGVRMTLFQYTTCPFCCKVRALLDYYGLSYDVIEVDPVLRQQLKVFQGYKKVPILVISRNEHKLSDNKEEKDTFFIDEPMQVNDSSLIISLLASYFTCNPGLQDNLNQLSEMYPAVMFADLEENKAVSEVVNKYFLMKGDHMDREEYKRVIKGLSEERKWREWADRVLVHTLSPNVYQTLDESLNTFKVFSQMGDWETHFPTWERLLVIYAGAFAMWLIGKRLKKRHGLKDDVRESLYDATKEWLTYVSTAGKGLNPGFAGGAKPNLADLTVYGVFHSIEGTDAFSELLMHPKIAPKFKKWYTAVKEQVMLKKGSRELVQILKHRVQ